MYTVGELVVSTPDSYVEGAQADKPWVITDLAGKPIAGVYQGGSWFSVTAEGKFLPLDAEGNILSDAKPLTFEELGGYEPARIPAPSSGGVRTGGQRIVAGAAAGILVVNDVLSMINRNLDQSRLNIAVGIATIDFWTLYGANPKWRLWDWGENKPLPPDASPEKSVIGNDVIPYVQSIDLEAFRANLPNIITNYKEFLMFLQTMRAIKPIREDPPMPDSPSAEELARPRRYTATLNWPERDFRKFYDLTDIIAEASRRTLADLNVTMRTQMGKLSPAEQENIFRLRKGSATDIYRAAGGGHRWKNQPIVSAHQVLGPDPWVRPIGPRKNDKALVVAANADAERSSLVSVYIVRQSLSDTMDEVIKGGRPIIEQIKDDGKLVNFVAGPEPGDSRFGDTAFHKWPGEEDWTVAEGELKQFWVEEDDLVPVLPPEVMVYAQPPGGRVGP
jgi:hypothetical protein